MIHTVQTLFKDILTKFHFKIWDCFVHQWLLVSYFCHFFYPKIGQQKSCFVCWRSCIRYRDGSDPDLKMSCDCSFVKNIALKNEIHGQDLKNPQCIMPSVHSRVKISASSPLSGNISIIVKYS